MIRQLIVDLEAKPKNFKYENRDKRSACQSCELWTCWYFHVEHSIYKMF